MSIKLLNIACGDRYHRDWINIDFHSSSSEVKSINILNGLPFSDNSFDVVYSSHFLEHLTIKQADFILKEIYRVLNKGGIVRLVVPDLENICREYLEILSKVNDSGNKKKYEWIKVELLDQMVRTHHGGEMLKIYENLKTVKDSFLREYISMRVGERFINTSTPIVVRNTFLNKLMRLNIKKIRGHIFYSYIFFVKLLFPASLSNGLILNTSIGERHLWMYDKYSLAEIILRNGFHDPKFFSHIESQIPKFTSYHLDTNEDGTPYKGVSSLYCEALKP